MEIWNNSLLITSGGWEDVEKAAQSVQSTVIDRLLEQKAMPLSLGLSYWAQVRSSGLAGLGLFYTQQSPLFMYRLFKEPSLPISQLGIVPHWHTHVKWEGSFTQRVSSVLRFVVGQWRRLREFFYRPMRFYANSRRKKLLAARNEAATEIGTLLQAAGSCQERIRCLASVVGINPDGLNLDTPDSCLDALQAVLDHKSALSVSSTVAETALPPTWVRWWPAAAAAVVGAYYLNGSWDKVLHWFETSVLETLQAFWQNWVVEPLYQIYLTIRHDPNGQVALIAKESLSTDVASLVQMVVDFARDTNPTLTAADLDAIRSEAQNGNVSPVMAVYNKQLEAPLTNLVTGKLIRTLLIQVQKSKVDAEVAISGIDQLLGSQQLVFGFLAALPALGLVTYLFRKLGSRKEHTEVLRENLLVRLGNIDEVVQSANAEHSGKLSDLDLGLVYCEIALIKRAAGKRKSEGRKQFLRSADRLLDLAINTRDTQAILGTLDRIYMRYSYYSQ